MAVGQAFQPDNWAVRLEILTKTSPTKAWAAFILSGAGQ
jgi:hypothetical protein